MKFRNMQQQAEEMRENQSVKANKLALRAMERQAKMPQLMIHPDVETTSGAAVGGGKAGLRRVVGAGKRKAKVECESESDEELEGGAKHMGRLMYDHLAKVHGEKYARRFMKGGFGVTSAPPQGQLVTHATMEHGGLPGAPATAATLPKGAIAPVAYGGVPQAPASFKRNAVDLGAPGILPSAIVGTGKPKRTSARGQKIRELMKSKGMSLPEASKYLKDHPE